MRRPSFQFYPADWRNNANLRRCSPAARGVWVDVMCVLHDSDDYGIVHWPLADLANSANAPLKLVRELVDKSVLKGIDKGDVTPYIYTPRSGRRDGAPVTLVPTQPGPVWYSSRMVKDEYVRTIRGEHTRFGDDDGEAPKAAPKPPKGDGSTSASSSSPMGKTSEAKASGGKPPAEKLPPDPVKQEIWDAGRSLLLAARMPAKQVGTFLGKLVQDYGAQPVLDAVRAAVKEQPADPAEYLKACCLHAVGQRKPAEPEWRTEQRERTQLAAPGVAVGSQPAAEFFIDVEAKNVTSNTLDRQDLRQADADLRPAIPAALGRH